jgi:hypothetical protein
MKNEYTPLLLNNGRGYIIPLKSRKLSVKSLNIYNAQTKKALILKYVLMICIRVGLVNLLARKQVISNSIYDIIKYLESHLNNKNIVVSISLGTPGPHRKPVIQIMSEKGDILGYGKVGWDKETNELVQNEINILIKLSKRPLNNCDVPTLIHSGSWMDSYICIQSPPDSMVRDAPKEMNEVYMEILNEMAGYYMKKIVINESSYYNNIVEGINQINNAYYIYVLQSCKRIIDRTMAQRRIPFHFCHGDFTPWNAYSVNGRIFLYDWEYSRMEYPAGYDLFHFLTQTSQLLQKSFPGITYNLIFNNCSIKEMTISYWNRLNIDYYDLEQLYLLYISDRIAFYAPQKDPNFKTLQYLSGLANLIIHKVYSRCPNV